MPAFLKDVTPFLGTGIKNEEGKDLNEFLEGYNSRAFECPSVTADILVFQYKKGMKTAKNGMKLLMIQRRNHPSIGYWALPGGFVNIREDIKEAAKRELHEETGLSGVDLTQLYCWGDYARDPRTRIVTISYLAMVEDRLKVSAGDDAADALWFDISLKDAVDTSISDVPIKSTADSISVKGRHVNADGNVNTDENVHSYGNVRHDEQIIELECKERGIKIRASVIRKTDTRNVFGEPEYIVKWSDKIAFDHPCFILQALDRIEQRL